MFAREYMPEYEGKVEVTEHGLYTAQCHRCGCELRLGRAPFKTETCDGCSYQPEQLRPADGHEGQDEQPEDDGGLDPALFGKRG